MTQILNARIRTGSAYSQLDKDALCYLYLLSLYMRETATRSLRDTVKGTQKYKLGAELKNTTNRIKEFERHAKTAQEKKAVEEGEDRILTNITLNVQFATILLQLPQNDEVAEWFFDELEKLKFQAQNKFRTDVKA